MWFDSYQAAYDAGYRMFYYMAEMLLRSPCTLRAGLNWRGDVGEYEIVDGADQVVALSRLVWVRRSASASNPILEKHLMWRVQDLLKLGVELPLFAPVRAES